MKTKQIVVRIEEKLYKELKTISEKRDSSIAWVIRSALKEYVQLELQSEKIERLANHEKLLAEMQELNEKLSQRTEENEKKIKELEEREKNKT